MAINAAQLADATPSNPLVDTIDYFFDNILGLDGVSSLADISIVGTDENKEIKIKISAKPGQGVLSLIETFSIPLTEEKISKFLNKEIDITDYIKQNINDFVDAYIGKIVKSMDGYERGVATAATGALRNLLSARVVGDIAHELGASLTQFDLPDLDALGAAFGTSLSGLASNYYNMFVPDVLEAYGKIGISEILTAVTGGLDDRWVDALHTIQQGVLDPILSNIVDRYFNYGPFLPDQIFDNVKFTDVLGKVASDILVDYDALDKHVIDDILGLDGQGWLDTELAPLLTDGLNRLVEGAFVKSMEFLAGKFSADDLETLFDDATSIATIQQLLGTFFTKQLGEKLTSLFVSIDSLEEGLLSKLGSAIVSNALGDTIGSLAMSAISDLFGQAAASAIGASIFEGLGAVLGAGLGGVAGSLVFEALDHLFNGALSGLIGDLIDWIRNDSPQSFYRVAFNPETNGFEYVSQYHKDSDAKLDNAVKTMSQAFENSVEQVIAFIGQSASMDTAYDDITMVWGKKHYDEKFAAYRENQETLRTAFNGNASVVVNSTVGMVLRHMDFHTGDPIIAKAYEVWKAEVGTNAADAAFADANNLVLLQGLVGLARFANQYRQDPTSFDDLIASDTPIGITILQQFLEAQALGFNDAAVLKGSILKTETIGSAGAGDTIYLDGPASRAVARGGDDTIHAGAALRQEIDGGAGTDLLVLAKARDAYGLVRIDRADKSLTLMDKATGAQIMVRDVETFSFAGAVLSFDQAFTNHRPVFLTGESTDPLAVAVPTNGVFIANVSAKDADDDSLVYRLGGMDADNFIIDETGRLEFRSIPSLALAGDKDRDGVYEVTVTATDGSDAVVRSYYVRPASTGDKGNFVFGGGGDDTIGLYLAPAGQSKVTIYNDIVYGHTGADTIYGDKGDDYLNGGDGDDVLGGDDGDDILQGGAGDDKLYGWYGTDHIYGGAGRDLLLGDWGDDTLDGGADDDTLFGYEGNDTLHGGAGNDTMVGDAGNDAIDAGDGNNSLWGGAGDDTLEGGVGSDTIDGGAGTDIASYASARSRIEVDLSILEDQNTRGAGTDTLISIENVVGSNFDDVLAGNAGANLLNGGDGDDLLKGDGGADVLAGGAGADHFIFVSLSDSTKTAPDQIVDFMRGDLIDLQAIDANTTAAGDQAFHLGATFGHVGDIILTYDTSANRTVMNLYVDGDNVADATIWLTGNLQSLATIDFIL